MFKLLYKVLGFEALDKDLDQCKVIVERTLCEVSKKELSRKRNFGVESR